MILAKSPELRSNMECPGPIERIDRRSGLVAWYSTYSKERSSRKQEIDSEGLA